MNHYILSEHQNFESSREHLPTCTKALDKKESTYHFHLPLPMYSEEQIIFKHKNGLLHEYITAPGSKRHTKSKTNLK
jgi:hypothetical protein